MDIGNEEMLLELSSIRRKYKGEFHEMKNCQNSLLEASIIVVVNFTLMIVGSLISISIFQMNAILSVPIYLGMLLFLGTRFRAFGNIVHECAHDSFVKGRKWNDFFGNLLAIFLMYSFQNYKRDHITHHLYTGDYDKDLEFSNTKEYGFHKTLNRRQIVFHLKRLITFEHVLHYTGRCIYTKSEPIIWRVTRALYLGVLFCSCVLSGWTGEVTALIAGYLVVAYFTTYPAIGYITDILDHGGLIGAGAVLEKTRNYTVKNKIVNLVFFPRNDTYHLTHHLLPTIPIKFSHKCHEILLKESAEYRSMPHDLYGWINRFLASS
jgi:fatty acid desaturase